MSTLKHHEIMAHYVDVCNQALQGSRDRFPFKQILGAAKASEKGAQIEVCVQDWPATGLYVFEVKENGIECKPHAECPDCECVRTWQTQSAYLESVIDDPEAYIQNPAKINWEWMYDIGAAE